MNPHLATTTARLTEGHLQPPAEPQSPFRVPSPGGSPFRRTSSPFTSSPFRQRSPFATAGPWRAGPGDRRLSPFDPPAPFNSRDGDRTGRASSKGSRPAFVQRTTIIISPSRPRRRSTYAFPYDTALRIWAEYNQCCTEEDVLEVGNGLDFTLLGQIAADADHNNEYCPYGSVDDQVVWEDALLDADGNPPGCNGFHGIDAHFVEPSVPLWEVADDVLSDWRHYADLEDEIWMKPEDVQILVFERIRQGSPALEGKYLVAEAINHEWSDDRPAGAPQRMVGWREVVVAPCDGDWQLE